MTGGGAGEVSQRFFVSYTGVDVRWAEWVAWTLEAAGHEALIQAWDFSPGSHFVGEMQRALSDDRRTVAVLSAAYLESAFATEEWQAAWAADPAGTEQRLLVVRAEDCDRPGLLRQVVSVDLFGVSREEARIRLLEMVRLGRRKPTVEPDFPAGPPAQGSPAGPARSAAPARSDGPARPAGSAGGSAEAAPTFPAELPEVWNVPPRLGRFVGREQQLAAVAKELAARGSAAVCAVHGSGGVGKSALAVEFAYRQMGSFDVVWWVNAQDPELIAGQVAALGVELGLADGAQWPAVAGELRRRRRRWLLVLDNVENLDGAGVDGAGPAVVGPLRPADPWGRLLVTSRLVGVAGGGVEVGEFSPDEAVSLLTGRVGSLDAAVAGRIAELLGYLPLALEQAAGYLRQTGMPAGEYADLLARRLGDMVGRGWVADRPGVTVANLWELSTSRLRAEQPEAAVLLELCAVCGPDPVPLDLFTSAVDALPDGLVRQAAGDPVQWADTVGALVGYSLARRDGPALTVHRLVAAATQAAMAVPERTATTAVVVRLLAATLPADVRDPAGWPRWRELLPHIRTVLDGDDSRWDDPTAREVSWLCDRTGLYLEHHGRPDVALDYLHRGLTLDATRLGPDHPDTLASRNNLAGAYETVGRVEQAIALYERTLADAERVLDQGHPFIATFQANLEGARAAAERRRRA